MDSFIKEVLSEVLKVHTNISELIFVVPSKRAGLFLKRELLQQLSNRILFSPVILSIEEFVSQLSGLRQIDGIQSLFEFYTTYLQTFPEEEKESFETFSNWAQTLLQDFNEVDRYCIDHQSFFSYLSAIQDLNHWYLQSERTPLIQRYIKFWENLGVYYKEFTKHLLHKKIGYQGLLYRKAAENCAKYCEDTDQQHILLGFNALNNAEQTIFQSILDTKKGVVYWDADRFFIENKYHEAALFLRNYKTQWNYYKENPFCWIKDHFSESKDIQLVGVPKNIGQVKFTGEILRTISPAKLERTALVLADESLLIPVLNALPSTIPSLNITMGLPIQEIPLASFFEQFFILHKNTGAQGFYYKSVLKILNTQAAFWLLGSVAVTIISEIKKQNVVFLSLKKIEQLSGNGNSESIRSLFGTVDDASKALEMCKTIIKLCKDKLDAEKDTLPLEHLYHFHLVFNQLSSLQHTYNYIHTVGSLHKLYNEVIRSETLDFRGEPFSGLQLMGMLESRCLDFETVIITSVNEGILPAGKGVNSFIPYELKRAYNLPTYKEKDAIYTYHFYRLLQRAKNIYLLYNMENEGVGGGEKSRFLRQLEIDKQPAHRLTNYIASSAVPKLGRTVQEIPKNEEVIVRLKELASHGFSPSALTTYIRNPIDFYNSYVLGIQETEEVEETVAANTLGTIIHNTLENLYKPLQNKLLRNEDINKMNVLVEKEVTQQFRNQYADLNITKGKNLLIYEVAKRYIHNFLKQEEKMLRSGAEIKIVSIESNLKARLMIAGLDFPVFLKGKVDRIDQIDGTLRIIDYKTGKVLKNQVIIRDWEMITKDYKYSKALQVLAYGYMYQQQLGSDVKCQAGIISFKNLGEGFMPFGTKESVRGKADHMITKTVFDQYEQQLGELINEIFDPNIPFTEKEI